MHVIMGFILPRWAESQWHMVVIKCVRVCVCTAAKYIPANFRKIQPGINHI